jgi:ABC-2 type transport system ATP-binding protein
VIEIQELYKYYGDRRAIGPLTTEIQKGEIIGLLGLNGAGKTTTLRVLACDLLPTSGTVKVGGYDVVEAPDEVRARVGYLPDRPPVYEDMTVGEYLDFAARLRRVPGPEVKKRVEDAVEVTEVGDRRHQLIGTLSHGFRQRVGIAQAIVHRPDFVVLDEPISGLDPLQIVEMRRLVRSLGGAHTVVVSSHNLPEIRETCDRILVIEEGRIAWSGTESQLSQEFDAGMQIEVTTRGASEARIREALSALPGIEAVESQPPSESGEEILTTRIVAASDVRDAVSRALVQRDIALLGLMRRRALESMVIQLLAGDDASRRPSNRELQEDEAVVAESSKATETDSEPRKEDI